MISVHRKSCSPRPVNGIQKVVVEKPFEIKLTNFSAVEKKLPEGVVILYAARSPVVRFIFTSTMAAEICVFLNLTVDQAITAVIRQP